MCNILKATPKDVANPFVNVRVDEREFLTKQRLRIVTHYGFTVGTNVVIRLSPPFSIPSTNDDKRPSCNAIAPQCLHTAALADVLQRSALEAALSRRFGCLCPAPATEGGQMSLL